MADKVKIFTELLHFSLCAYIIQHLEPKTGIVAVTHVCASVVLRDFADEPMQLQIAHLYTGLCGSDAGVCYIFGVSDEK